MSYAQDWALPKTDIMVPSERDRADGLRIAQTATIAVARPRRGRKEEDST